MMTAVCISREKHHPDIKGVKHVNLYGRIFANAKEVQKAWFDAVGMVETERFFFVDDSDHIPPDALRQCEEFADDLVYTDELVIDGNEQVRKSKPYSQADHLLSPLMLHHLVICKTKTAREAIELLPRGHYWPEMLLYWGMAKQGTAKYVPVIGYHWHRSHNGLSRKAFTSLAVMRSMLWCKANP